MYLWFVLLHLAGLVVFLAMHGVSMAVRSGSAARRSARRSSPADLSSRAVQIAYLGLILSASAGWEPRPTSAG